MTKVLKQTLGVIDISSVPNRRDGIEACLQNLTLNKWTHLTAIKI